MLNVMYLNLLMDFVWLCEAYILHVKASMDSCTSSETVSDVPNAANAAWKYADFFKSLYGTNLPFLTKALVESHPVKACNPGSAADRSGPSDRDMALMSMSFR